MHAAFLGEATVESNFTRDQFGNVVISSYVPILDTSNKVVAVLGLDYDVQTESERIQELKNFSIVIVLVTLAIAAFLSYFVARQFSKPISQLKEGAERVASRDFSFTVDVKARNELGSLADSFNSMVSRIQNYSQSLQRISKSFERFVPHQFLQQMGKRHILNVNLGDHAEREMSVLFSDIRSFTSLSENMTPKGNFDFINSYFGHVSPIIRNHSGFIDKFIGDSIMALFSRDSSDAISAAIEMLLSLREFNRSRTKEAYVDIGVGIHTGKLILGTVGEEKRMESTVISDVVNVASRLESLCKRFSVNIIVSKDALEKSSRMNSLLYRSLGLIHLRGKMNALEVFEVYDHNTPEQIELKEQSKKSLTEGIHFFGKASFNNAKAIFSEILQRNPQDSVAKCI